jgi:transposase
MVVIVRGRTVVQTQTQRRCIGLDVHREFAQVAIWQGGLVIQAGRFATTPEGVRAFAEGLGPADEVALEATGNTWAIATLLASRAGRVVVSNPAKTRAIAEAKVKTDKVDAEILAQLLAADYLPAVWRPDPATAALRRQVLRRAHIVRQRTRLKNQVHAILHRNLIPRCPAADLFGHKGRRWLAEQDLPPDEQAAAVALLRQLDFHAEELRLIDTDLGQAALARPEVLRLMTVPGIDATVALSIVAAVGDFTRFRTPEKLVAYLGLNPRVRQSGGQPASHGRITKAGSAHARGMLVEAAWSASKAPGPLRAFYQRVCARRGMQVAVVAAARKLTVLCWHLIIKGEDYAYAQPSLVAHKRRKLELRAGHPATRGRTRSGPPNVISQHRPRWPTGPRSPPGNPPGPPPEPRHARRARTDQGWTWPPPLGRDFQGPLGATRRGRADSPTPCSSRRGRPRPPPPNATPVLTAVKVVRPRCAAGAPP